MLSSGLFPIFMLYPEIHYRFRFWPFSRYFKKEPEILVDCPYKTVAGNQLPIFLLIKDADHYPVQILSIQFVFKLPDNSVVKQKQDLHFKINSPFYSQVFYFNFSQQQGFCELEAEITYKIGKKIKKCINDNFLIKEKTLSVYLNDNETLFPNSLQGDLHIHSSYTADQVEYGALPSDLKLASIALNQQFAALTDHSYDLDDYADNYLINDPELEKFHEMQLDCASLSDEKFCLINGEEVTVRNSQDRNVHLLVLSETKFLEGKGDSAEKWLDRHSKFSVNAAVQETSSDAVLLAAHPLTPTPWLEYLLIKRGEWQLDDLLNPRIKVWQIMNGEEDIGFITGIKLWQQQLLAGQIKYIAAGNDSHGNFGVFRQIKLPMFKMIRLEKQLFGRWRTVVLTDQICKQAILEAVNSGKSYITNGPHLSFTVDEELICNINISSSVHSGVITKVMLLIGVIGQTREKEMEISVPKNAYNYSVSQKIECQSAGYLRVEVITTSKDRLANLVCHKAFSNPVFINII